MSDEKGMRPLDNEVEARLLEDEELKGIAGGANYAGHTLVNRIDNYMEHAEELFAETGRDPWTQKPFA